MNPNPSSAPEFRITAQPNRRPHHNPNRRQFINKFMRLLV
ncbi:unnamed protein product [Rhodiola kirilowii]